jgi:hypothetical protein
MLPADAPVPSRLPLPHARRRRRCFAMRQCPEPHLSQDDFLVGEGEDDEEGAGEGEEGGDGAAKRKKRKRRKERDYRLDDEDYDLLEDNQVMVSG